jgi:hypothetical protein
MFIVNTFQKEEENEKKKRTPQTLDWERGD